MADVHKFNKETALVSSMINNNLPTNAFMVSNDQVQKGFASEMVSFLVVHKPFTNLDTGANATYSIDIRCRANFGAYVRTDDMFSRTLIKNNAQLAASTQKEATLEAYSKGLVPLKETLDGYLSQTDKIKASRHLERNSRGHNFFSNSWKWLQDLYAKAKPYIGTALEVAEVASMLMDPQGGQEMVDVVQLRANLRHILGQLRPLKDVPQIADAIEIFKTAMANLEKATGPFMPVSEVFPQAPTQKLRKG